MATLSFGCDDPEVSSAVSSALVYGSVTAQVTCAGMADLPQGTSRYMYVETVFLDGSGFISLVADPNGTAASQFFMRGAARDLVWRTDGVTCDNRAKTDSGDLVFYGTGSACGSTFDTVDIETSCTGFNLEAFGVE